MTKMPFGKHKGVLISELPGDYIKWLYSEVELREPLRSLVDQEIELRYGRHNTGAPHDGAHLIRISTCDVATFREIVERGYKLVAGSRHPDRGGSTTEMVHVNAVVASVRAQIAAIGACR